MGSVSANEKHWDILHQTQDQLGVCPQGDDCYAVLRGMRTMAIRLSAHEKSAIEVATWLKDQKQVARVLHPALPSDPGHEIWKRDFSGSSGLFGFILKDASDSNVGQFLDALEFFGMGYSWGGYESLALAVNSDDRTIAHAPEGGRLMRLQIGLEDTKDLIADLDQALKGCGL